jgi:N-acetylglutamate synthase-like GNAT family acetyltransferase
MQIRDLSEADLPLYFCCLEDYAAIMEQGKELKQQWYKQMKDKGLRVKLAIDDDGKIAGMIQYLPVEHSHIIGKDMYFIYCIWVHGHKMGIGNRQKRGMGKALLSAAETDAQDNGAKGIIAWGLRIPVWMKAAWFRKQGFIVADKQSMMALVYKPFTGDARKPAFPKQKKKPEIGSERVILTDFVCGWCPFTNVTHANASRLADEYPDKVQLITYDATDQAVLEEWGIGEGLFINGKEVRSAPPLAYDILKRKVMRRMKPINK